MEAWPIPDPATARPAPGMVVRPTPTDEEAAAIVAAMAVLWPKRAVTPEPPSARRGAWRFSGRWWSRPVAARRSRPWY